VSLGCAHTHYCANLWSVIDKWIGTACEVAEQIGPLFVKFIFQHGSPNNPDYWWSLSQVSFDRRVGKRKITSLLARHSMITFGRGSVIQCASSVHFLGIYSIIYVMRIISITYKNTRDASDGQDLRLVTQSGTCGFEGRTHHDRLPAMRTLAVPATPS
jgi:hypothetical protein